MKVGRDVMDRDFVYINSPSLMYLWHIFDCAQGARHRAASAQ